MRAEPGSWAPPREGLNPLVCVERPDAVIALGREVNGAVVMTWVRKIPEESLFISAVTLGEIQAGIEITRTQKPDKAAEIEGWLVEDRGRRGIEVTL